MTHYRPLSLAVLLAVGVLALVASAIWVFAEARGSALPEPVCAQLRTLADAYMPECQPPYFGGTMRSELNRHRQAIHDILACAIEDRAEGRRFASHLSAALRAFALQYGPGASISRDTLTRTTWDWGSRPDHGLGIHAHLLTEVARKTVSRDLVREALGAMCAAEAAASNLSEQQVRTRIVVKPSDIPSDGMHSHLGGQIAWCCETMMAQLSEQPAPWMTLETCAVVDEFVAWRTQRTKGHKLFTELSFFDQHLTMQWVARLAAAIPEG